MRARLPVTLLGILLLAGCGQKGPLYLPEPEPSAVETVTETTPPDDTAPAAGDDSEPVNDSTL